MNGPWRDLFMFIGLLVLLFIVWASTGGPQRAMESPSASLGTRGGTSASMEVGSPASVERDIRGIKRDVKDIEERLEELVLESVASPYRDLVSFAGGAPKRSLSPEEYVRLRSSRSVITPINITGWRIESLITGTRGTIPGAAALPVQGTVNNEAPLLLGPSQTVIVHSGRSPIGISFRDNLCAGYLDPRDRFTPRLRRQCPDPEDEFEEFSGILPTKVRDEKYDECREYVDRHIKRCEIDREELDQNDEDIDLLPLSSQCIEFIRSDLTYQGCVRNHQNDPDFFDNEWRVFLGSGPGELWREDREVLRLLDREGRVVDVWQY